MNFTKNESGQLAIILNGVQLDGLYDRWNVSKAVDTVILPTAGDSLVLWNDLEAEEVSYTAMEVEDGFVWEQVF